MPLQHTRSSSRSNENKLLIFFFNFSPLGNNNFRFYFSGSEAPELSTTALRSVEYHNNLSSL